MPETGWLIRMDAGGEQPPDFNYVPVIGFGETGRALLSGPVLEHGPPSDYWLVTDGTEGGGQGHTIATGWPDVREALAERLSKAPIAILVGKTDDPAAPTFQQQLGEVLGGQITPTLWLKPPTEGGDTRPLLADRFLESCWEGAGEDCGTTERIHGSADWHLNLLWALLAGVSEESLVGQDPADLPEALRGQAARHARGTGSGSGRVTEAIEEAVGHLDTSGFPWTEARGWLVNVMGPLDIEVKEIGEAQQALQDLEDSKGLSKLASVLGAPVGKPEHMEEKAEIIVELIVAWTPDK